MDIAASAGIAAVGIAAGLVAAAVLAVTAGRRHLRATAGARAVTAAMATYLIVILPLLTVGGVSLAGWLLLAGLMLLPILGSVLLTTRVGSQPPDSAVGRIVGAGSAVVAVGLTAVLLIAAGQTTALLGRVNPVVAMVTVAATAALIALANGVRGVARVGRWLFWVLVVLAAVLAAAGLALGRRADLIDPVMPVDALPVWGYVALVIGLLAVGSLDPALRSMLESSGLHGHGPRAGAWAALWTVVIVLVVGLGMLLVFGGALVAPSLAFFTVPANLGPAVPMAMVIAAFWFAFAIASLLAGAAAPAGEMAAPAGEMAAPGRREITTVVGLVLVALVITLLPIPSAVVLAATAAAAVVGLLAAGIRRSAVRR